LSSIGCKFDYDLVTVLFDKIPGRILEVEDNLISVMAPRRPDLTCNTAVEIEVSNKVPNTKNIKTTVSPMKFTYIVEKPPEQEPTRSLQDLFFAISDDVANGHVKEPLPNNNNSNDESKLKQSTQESNNHSSPTITVEESK
jgi:hypothetical protein